MQPRLMLMAVAFAVYAIAAQAKGSSILEPVGPPVRLDGALTEISGLAPAGAARVYAHNDEAATIFELDAVTGAIVRRFSLGRPAVTGDFEAISLVGDTLSLITSNGRIHEATIEPDRRVLEFRVVDIGLGATCEIEGFAPVDDASAFLVACKEAGPRLNVYKWSRAGGAAPFLSMKLKGVVPNPRKFRAADLVFDETTQTLLVLDSGAGAILEVSPAGEPVGYWRLAGSHPQAEGLALLPDGRLLVADEGKAGAGGTLTTFRRRR